MREGIMGKKVLGAAQKTGGIDKSGAGANVWRGVA